MCQRLGERSWKYRSYPDRRHHPAKRNPGLTNMLSNPKMNRLVRNLDNPTPLDHPFRYLGYTYKFGNYIVGHSDNIGRQIIDVQALYLDPVMKGYSDVIPILTTDAKQLLTQAMTVLRKIQR